MNIMLPDFRVRQRDYLLEISRALTQELDLDKLLDRILTISLEMLAGQAGLIALRKETQGWQINVSKNLPPAFLRYIEPQLAQIPEYEDPQDVELNMVNRIFSELTRATTMGRLSSFALPLITGPRVVGVIIIFRGYAEFTANDRAVLSSFANQAAIAVKNAQLYAQVNNDRQRMDALIDVAADGILILKPDLTVERVNSAFSFIAGGRPDDYHNLPHSEVIQWQKPPEGQTLEMAAANGWPMTSHATLYVEGDLMRKGNPLPIPVGISYAPLLSPDGTLLNVITTVRDITRFRQADELKSTFISVVSHELKTPVALIKGYVSTLRREDARWDRKMVNESLQIIEEEADRLAEYIENLLDASRVQAHGFNLNFTDVQLADLIQHTVDRLQTQTAKHTLVVEIPSKLPVIQADEVRISQVLSNLINNSIKYAPGGEIRIRAALKGQDIITCISDEGPGINPNDAPHIFDRFYRSPDAIRNTKGAGLGLFLTREIITGHGGEIWVDTETGKGARICFCLPVNRK
jgi:K+-sensing histidine kinase KdpD